MPHALAKCSAPGMWACSGCHNWVVLTAECGEAGKPTGGQQCERHGNYSVMRQAPSAHSSTGHPEGADRLPGTDSSYSVQQAPSAHSAIGHRKGADQLLGTDSSYSVRQAPSAGSATGQFASAGARLLSGPVDMSYRVMQQAPSARNPDLLLGPDDNHSVVRQAPSVRHGRRCVAEDRWLLLPNIACTGIEDLDPACTGPAGEFWWQAAWQEGLAHGFPDPWKQQQQPSLHSDSGEAALGLSSRSRSSSSRQLPGAEWVLLMASPAYRAHQQMHIHIGRISANKSLPLARVLRSGDLDGSGKLPIGCVSRDAQNPSVRIVKVPLPSDDALLDADGTVLPQQRMQHTMKDQPLLHVTVQGGAGMAAELQKRRGVEVPVVLVSVFVPADSAADIAGKVRPFETARTAAAVRQAAGVPYVLMVTAHRQPLHGCDAATAAAAGAVDAATSAAASSAVGEAQEVLLLSVAIDAPGDDDGGGFAAGFVVTAMVRGASPDWIMEARATDDCFDTCPLPPQPS